MISKNAAKPVALRAATYTRYSSDQQKESSIEDQQRNCHARAAKEGWTVVRDFADAAISGSDNNRPQYLAMIAAAKRHEFDVLLLDDLSRLTRDSLEQETTIRTLEFSGGCNVRIVSVGDGYDSEQQGRKLHRALKGAMNEVFLDDLRARVHRGQTGQALKKYWLGGRPYGFRLKPILDSTKTDPYGQPERIGTVLVVDPVQAKVVQEIFTRYVAGESCLAIASELNRRAVPSAGSTWKRTTHRSSGWMNSSVRAILRNRLYVGEQRWNASQFVKNPESNKYLRRQRPMAEWVVNDIPSLRIVGNELFELAQQRTRGFTNPDARLKAGGKAKFLLSGLLHCSVCGRHYVIADKYSYGCSSYIGGGKDACSNSARVNRESLEGTLLGPIRKALGDPARVKRMAAEMEREFAKRMAAREARATAIPAEVQALDARLAQLRAMADLTDEERQMLVGKAEAKRKELLARQPAAKAQAKILTMLPKAAASYLAQIEEGLGGDVRAAAKGRLVVKDLIGPVSLQPGDHGSLWATYNQNLWSLVRATAGTGGRGDRI